MTIASVCPAVVLMRLLENPIAVTVSDCAPVTSLNVATPDRQLFVLGFQFVLLLLI